MNVSILIATYGDERWSELAWSRAYPSTIEQGAHEVLVGHDPEGTLASARNDLAAEATGEWLCFLDADDELAPGYRAAMTNMIYVGGDFPDGTYGWRLYTPRVQYVHGPHRQPPKFWREVDLRHANWLVIGTLVPRALFHEVGGFREERAYEDWSLFARCAAAGAEVVKVPDAIYVAHMRRESRNRGMTPRERVETHYEIGRSLFPDLYNEAWLRQHLRNAGVRQMPRPGEVRA